MLGENPRPPKAPSTSGGWLELAASEQTSHGRGPRSGAAVRGLHFAAAIPSVVATGFSNANVVPFTSSQLLCPGVLQRVAGRANAFALDDEGHVVVIPVGHVLVHQLYGIRLFRECVEPPSCSYSHAVALAAFRNARHAATSPFTPGAAPAWLKDARMLVAVLFIERRQMCSSMVSRHWTLCCNPVWKARYRNMIASCDKKPTTTCCRSVR